MSSFATSHSWAVSGNCLPARPLGLLIGPRLVHCRDVVIGHVAHLIFLFCHLKDFSMILFAANTPPR